MNLICYLLVTKLLFMWLLVVASVAAHQTTFVPSTSHVELHFPNFTVSNVDSQKYSYSGLPLLRGSGLYVE
jgi:hypothetical protein